MDKQKQVEEMAKVIMQPQDCKGYEDNRGCYFGNGKSCEKCKIARHENAQIMADYLYNAGYRKIPENAVVLTDKKDIQQYEWSKLIDKMGVIKFCEKLRKETAEKFAAQMKVLLSSNTYFVLAEKERLHKAIDEICKEITEGNG